MFAGLALLVASLIATLVVAFAARQRHVSSGDTEEFRYPTALSNAIALCVPAYVVMAVFVYLRFAKPIAFADFTGILLVFGSLAIGTAVAYWFIATFSAVVSPQRLIIIRWGNKKAYRWEEIQGVIVRVGPRGDPLGLVIRLHNGQSIRIGTGIQDFDDLVAGLQARVP